MFLHGESDPDHALLPGPRWVCRWYMNPFWAEKVPLAVTFHQSADTPHRRDLKLLSYIPLLTQDGLRASNPQAYSNCTADGRLRRSKASR